MGDGQVGKTEALDDLEVRKVGVVVHVLVLAFLEMEVEDLYLDLLGMGSPLVVVVEMAAFLQVQEMAFEKAVPGHQSGMLVGTPEAYVLQTELGLGVVLGVALLLYAALLLQWIQAVSIFFSSQLILSQISRGQILFALNYLSFLSHQSFLIFHTFLCLC